MPRLARCLLICLAFAFPAISPVRAADPLDGFDAYVAKAMAEWQTPGLSIAVVEDGRVVLARGYGVKKLGGDDAVDADTVFAAGSISKTFTSAAVAVLIARDRMRWDDRVIDHLPDFRLHDPYVTREIRLRDLLSHRSGLPRGEMLWYYSTFDRKEILHRLRYLKPKTGFRSRFGYQNLMFVAAGEAVAAASGKSWDSFVAETFFELLGMASTSTSITALGDNVATPHARVDGEYRPIAWLNVDNIAPAGGVNSTANDLVQWMRFQLDDGVANGTAMLRVADVAEMRTPQTIIPVSAERRAAIPETLFRSYGLGWYLEDYRDLRIAYHGGRIDGMSSRLTLVPERKLGIAVLTNRGRSSLADALTYRLLDAYLGAPKTAARDWSADLLKLAEEHFERRDARRAKLLKERVPETHPSLPLEKYAGTYDSDIYGGLDVTLDGGTLRLRRNAAAVAMLSHFNYDTFLAAFRSPALRDRLVTFDLDKLGRPEALELEFEDRFVNTTPPLPNDLATHGTAGNAAGGLIGVWTGRWDGVQPTTLAVESIDGDSAKVVYAWGPARAWRVGEGGWERHTARLSGDTLTFRTNGKIRVRYTLASASRLDALYTDGPRTRKAALSARR